MRVEFPQCVGNQRLGNRSAVHGIDIIFLYLLKDKFQFLPFPGNRIGRHQPTVRMQDRNADYHRYYDGQQYEKQCFESLSVHIHSFEVSPGFGSSSLLTSIPARASKSIPSVTRYSSEYTTLEIPACMISFAHSRQGAAVT